MRRRTLSEMIRDSRVGSVFIAKLIAVGLGGVIQALIWPLERILAPVLNFVVLHGFRNYSMPFADSGGKWSYSLLSLGLLLVFSAFWFGAAYLCAAWVYKPSPRHG